MPQRSFFSCLLSFSPWFLIILVSCNSGKEQEYPSSSDFDKAFTDADSLRHIGRHNAPRYLYSIYTQFPEVNGRDRYRLYKYLTWYYYEWATDTAALYADSALDVLQEHRNDPAFLKEMGEAQAAKGAVLLRQGRYAGAFDAYLKAKQINEQVGDSCVSGSCISMLGSICYMQEKYLDAAHYIRLSMDLYANCLDGYEAFKWKQAKLDDLGIFYGRAGRLDSAEYYFNIALRYLEEEKDKFPLVKGHKGFIEMAEAVVLGNLADVYVKKGKIAEAEKLYRQNIRVNSKPGYDMVDAQITRQKLASLLLEQQRLGEARLVLQDMRSIFTVKPMPWLELKWYRLQFDYLQQSGHMEEVQTLLLPYLHLRDSMEQVANIPQTDLNKEFQVAKNVQELELITKNAELKGLYLAIVIIVSVLAIAIAFLLWNNWQRSRKLNSQIYKKNEELQLVVNSLIESQEENTRLMRIVAHDLKSPVATIISIADVLNQSPQLGPEDKELIELVRTTGQHSVEMVNDLLNANSMAAGIRKEPVEIQNLLRYCVDLLQFKAAEKEQIIEFQAEPLTIMADREKIWRVLSNIIVNAIKFSPEKRSIQVSMKKKGSCVQIRIKDDGIGIPASLKEKVFQMFTDARRVGTSGEQPFGLGLAISRQIIEAHQGRIWFESEAGQGTEFFIELPL